MDRAPRGSARRDGHLERVDDELMAHVAVHRPADDPAAEEILHGSEVQPALTGTDLLDVRRPHAIRRVGSKVTADEVTERLDALHAHRATLAAPLERDLQAAARISRATRFSPTAMPSRASIACTRGLP
jgi:hypothetical protein